MWAKEALGTLIGLQNGFAFKSADYSDDGYFVMRITNVQQGYISNHNPKYIRIDMSSKLQRFVLREGDILVSLTGDVGRVGIIERQHLPCALNQRVARVNEIDSKKLLKSYLFHFLNSDGFRREIEKLAHGAAQANISTKDILSIAVPLPPLSEQQRIVEKLDAAFAEIDAAAEAERKKSDAILTLFTNYLNHAFDCDAADNGTVNLGDCCELQNGFAFKSSKFKSEGVPIIRISNIQSGEVSTQKLVYTDPADYVERLDKYIVVEGDLLIAMSGATTGKVGINNTANSYYLNQRVGLLRPKDTLLKNYLYFFLTTKVDENLSISAGAAQPNLSSKQIREIKIPNIPVEQQTEFMDKTELLERQQLEYLAATEQKILEYGKLKSAILAQELRSETV